MSFAPPCYSENFIFHNQNSALKQKWETTPENCLIFHTNSCMTQLVDFSFLSPNKNRSCSSAYDNCSFVVPYWQEHTRNKNRICTQLFITFGLSKVVDSVFSQIKNISKIFTSEIAYRGLQFLVLIIMNIWAKIMTCWQSIFSPRDVSCLAIWWFFTL